MSSSIFVKEFNPPQELLLKEEDIILFPTDKNYSDEDYVAVVMSRDFLREWGGDSWPEDSFSPTENFNDLENHVQDNISHRAYGYMIFSADKKKCLGSLYVSSLLSWSEYHELISGVDPREKFQARIDYWTRSDEPELERILIPKIQKWFKEVWKIKTVVVSKPGLIVRNPIIKELKLLPIASFRSKDTQKEMTMFELS
jgi:hypothetical protein